jgi:predicted nucleic acid-binding Zn finger protein
MISNAFKNRRAWLFKQLKQVGVLTPELERAITEIYGDRGKRALEAVKRQRVVKRGQRWFVRGKADEYEVFRDFCTCPDYVMNIATEKAGVDMCYHALAKNICEILNSYYVFKHES